MSLQLLKAPQTSWISSKKVKNLRNQPQVPSSPPGELEISAEYDAVILGDLGDLVPSWGWARFVVGSRDSKSEQQKEMDRYQHQHYLVLVATSRSLRSSRSTIVARDNPGAGVFFLPWPIVGAGERETEDKGLRT